MAPKDLRVRHFSREHPYPLFTIKEKTVQCILLGACLRRDRWVALAIVSQWPSVWSFSLVAHPMLKNDTEAAADQRIPFRSRAEGDQGKHENPALLCYRSLGEAERVWKIGYYCSAWALIGRGADAAVWCQRRLICTLHRFPTNLTWYRHQRLRRLISSGWVKRTACAVDICLDLF